MRSRDAAHGPDLIDLLHSDGDLPPAVPTRCVVRPAGNGGTPTSEGAELRDLLAAGDGREILRAAVSRVRAARTPPFLHPDEFLWLRTRFGGLGPDDAHLVCSRVDRDLLRSVDDRLLARAEEEERPETERLAYRLLHRAHREDPARLILAAARTEGPLRVLLRPRLAHTWGELAGETDIRVILGVYWLALAWLDLAPAARRVEEVMGVLDRPGRDAA